MTYIALLEMLDITEPEAVEIVIDSTAKRLWINVDGVCRLRVCQIAPGTLHLDNRAEPVGSGPVQPYKDPDHE